VWILTLSLGFACDGADASRDEPSAEAGAASDAEKSAEDPSAANADLSGPAVPEVTLIGTDPASPELERASAAWLPTIRACYAAAVRADPTSVGEVSVQIKAGRATVSTPGLPSSVRTCVDEAARSWDFAAFGATGDVKVRFDAKVRI
jgi:hypothetical protein